MMSEKYFLAKFFLKRIINHKHLPLLAMNISLLYGSSTASEKKKKKSQNDHIAFFIHFAKYLEKCSLQRKTKKKQSLPSWIV